MGILNMTPDSYFSKSRYMDRDKAIQRAKEIETEGADILDIGGESTFPGTEQITAQEEIERVVPVIQELSKLLTIPISIDTKKVAVAEAALNAGAACINDITGFNDLNMIRLAAESNVPIFVMHMQGDPRTMQDAPHYPEGVMNHLFEWFQKKIDTLINHGIRSENIFLDPGIGFGKTVAHNHEIIQNLPRLKELGFPLLLGVSRKLFIRIPLKMKPEEALAATIAMNTLAILSGADVIRVHDVQEHRDVIDILHISQRYQCNSIT